MAQTFHTEHQNHSKFIAVTYKKGRFLSYLPLPWFRRVISLETAFLAQLSREFSGCNHVEFWHLADPGHCPHEMENVDVEKKRLPIRWNSLFWLKLVAYFRSDISRNA